MLFNVGPLVSWSDEQNAGIGSPKKRLDELSMSDFRNVFETNVMAVILCSQHAIRLMKAQDPPGGR